MTVLSSYISFKLYPIYYKKYINKNIKNNKLNDIYDNDIYNLDDIWIIFDNIEKYGFTIWINNFLKDF